MTTTHEFLKNYLEAALKSLEVEMGNFNITPVKMEGALINPIMYRSSMMSVIQSVWTLVLMQKSLESVSNVFPSYSTIKEDVDLEYFEGLDIEFVDVKLKTEEKVFTIAVWNTELGGIIVGVPLTEIDTVYDSLATVPNPASSIILTPDNNFRMS